MANDILTPTKGFQLRSLFTRQPPPSEADGQADRTTVARLLAVARGHVEAVRRPLLVPVVRGRRVVVLRVDFGRVERLQGSGARHDADLDGALIGNRTNCLGSLFLFKMTHG